MRQKVIIGCGLVLLLVVYYNFYRTAKYFDAYWTIENCDKAVDLTGARNWCRDHGDLLLAQGLIQKRFENEDCDSIILDLTLMHPLKIEDQRLLVEDLWAASIRKKASGTMTALLKRMRDELRNPDEEIRFKAAWALGNLNDYESFERILTMPRPQSKQAVDDWMCAVASFNEIRAFEFLKECESSTNNHIAFEAKSRLRYRKLIGWD